MPESWGVITALKQFRLSPLWAPALCAGVGLGLAYHVQVAWLIPLALAALAMIGSLTLPRLGGGMLLAGFFFSFFTHGQLAYHHLPADALRFKGDFHQRTVFLRLLVDEEPKGSATRPGEIRVPAQILALRRGDDWVPVSGRMDGWLEVGAEDSPTYGDVIEAPVFLRRPDVPRNPATFDAPRYFRVRHLDYRGDIPAGEWRQVDQGQGWQAVQWAIDFRQHMRETLSAGLEDRPGSAALMAAMLFGERDGLSEEEIRQFEVTGTLHLFAVSGQNIQTIAIVMMVLLYALGLIRWRWGWLMITPLLIFVISTGMESSAVRAFLMASLIWIAYMLYRPVQPLNILSAAALLIWVVDPLQLFDLGFQFSFLVVLGLVLLGRPVYGKIYPLLAPDDYLPRKHLSVWRRRLDEAWMWLCALLATSFVAWCCSLPITVMEFHLFSPVAVLANVIVVPLASGVLVLSLASVIAGSVFAPLSLPINQLSALILKVVVATTGSLSSWPGAYQYVSPHPTPASGHLRIMVPSGYQSLTAWVETAEQTLLIGPGHERDWKAATWPCARYLGIDRVDHLVLSGANAATIGAFTSIKDQMKINKMVAGNWSSRSPAWKRWKEKSHDFPGRLLEETDAWEILSEPDEEVDIRGRSLEDESMIVSIRSASFRMLYVSNAGESSYQFLSQEIDQVDVLLIEPGKQKIPIPAELLSRLRPRLILLPPPGYSSTGILTPELWSYSLQSGADILEVEREGAVLIESDPEGTRYATFLPDGTFSGKLNRIP